MDLGETSFDYPFVRWCAGWDLNPQSPKTTVLQTAPLPITGYRRICEEHQAPCSSLSKFCGYQSVFTSVVFDCLLCWQFPWPSSPAFYQIAFPFCKSPSLTTVGLEPTICDRNLFCQVKRVHSLTLHALRDSNPRPFGP